MPEKQIRSKLLLMRQLKELKKGSHDGFDVEGIVGGNVCHGRKFGNEWTFFTDLQMAPGHLWSSRHAVVSATNHNPSQNAGIFAF